MAQPYEFHIHEKAPDRTMGNFFMMDADGGTVYDSREELIANILNIIKRQDDLKITIESEGADTGERDFDLEAKGV